MHQPRQAIPPLASTITNHCKQHCISAVASTTASDILSELLHQPLPSRNYPNNSFRLEHLGHGFDLFSRYTFFANVRLGGYVGFYPSPSYRAPFQPLPFAFRTKIVFFCPTIVPFAFTTSNHFTVWPGTNEDILSENIV